MRRFFNLLALSVSLLASTGTARAVGPTNIERTLPRMGQRGTTVEVIIQGAILKDPKEVIFFRPGIRAVGIEPLPDLKTRDGGPIRLALVGGAFMKEQMRCKFEIAPDCPLGEHPFRIRTATELTTLGTFHVSPFPCVDENETTPYSNDTLATAMPLTANVTVRGFLGQGSRGEVDVYRVPAAAGQQLSVEVDSVRIADNHYGASEFDLKLRILDEKGRELAVNDDNPLHLQDPVASVKLPHDGVAYIEIKRSVHSQKDTQYCVHIGTFRRSLVAFPAGGQCGQKQVVRLLGDPLGEFTESLDVPATANGFDYFGNAPSPVTLRASPHPNALENPQQGEPALVQLPAALNGIISGPEEVDHYRFAAKKGEHLQFRVFAATIGSTIDANIALRSVTADGKLGKVILESEDAKAKEHDIFSVAFRTGTGLKEMLDPSVIWDCTEDGDYVLEVRDSSGVGGPLGVYRVEAGPPPNKLFLVTPSQVFDWCEDTRSTGFAVPQGSSRMLTLFIMPGQGAQFPGEFDFVAHGLPKGVTLVPTRARGGEAYWPVQFVAAADAPLAGAVITLEARPINPAIKVTTICQQYLPFVNFAGGDAWRTVRLDRFILAVTEPPPFSIEFQPPAIPLVRSGGLAIPVKIVRRPGFTGAVRLRPGWLAAGVHFSSPLLIPPDKTEGELELTGGPNAPLGPSIFAITGSTVREDFDDYVGTGHIRVTSAPSTLTVAAPFVELTSELLSIRRGERKKYIWNVKHPTPLPGTVQVRLLGLPAGLRVIEPLPVLTQDTSEIAFEIEATDDALLGRVGELSCAIVISSGGQQTEQRTGKGALRIDPRL